MHSDNLAPAAPLSPAMATWLNPFLPLTTVEEAVVRKMPALASVEEAEMVVARLLATLDAERAARDGEGHNAECRLYGGRGSHDYCTCGCHRRAARDGGGRRPLVCCLCLFVGPSDDPDPVTVINGALVCEPHNGYFQGGDHVQALIAWKREHPEAAR